MVTISKVSSSNGRSMASARIKVGYLGSELGSSSFLWCLLQHGLAEIDSRRCPFADKAKLRSPVPSTRQVLSSQVQRLLPDQVMFPPSVQSTTLNVIHQIYSLVIWSKFMTPATCSPRLIVMIVRDLVHTSHATFQSFNTFIQDANHPLWSRSFLHTETPYAALMLPTWKMPEDDPALYFSPQKVPVDTSSALGRVLADAIQAPSACRIGTMPVLMGMPCEQRTCLRQHQYSGFIIPPGGSACGQTAQAC